VANRFVDKLARFATLDDGDVAALTRATANARWVPTRRDLIREGDRPGAVFVILEGWACRYKICQVAHGKF
jgi:CRP-like cAMP-binding protein